MAGLATRSLVEVAPLQAIHSLPHQRSRALLGVANVRGALVACLSLVELLGLDGIAAPATGARIMPRMLIIAAQAGRWWCRWMKSTASTPSTSTRRGVASGTQASAKYTRGVLQCAGAACVGWMKNSCCPP
jgi:chemotaxis-related protein WspD